MAPEQFWGVWQLISYEFRLADGILIRPMGQGVRGLLMYDRTGYMMLQVMDPDRLPFQSGDWLKGTPEEIQSAWEGAFSYYGTFELDERRQLVIHHIQGAAFPNWMDTARELFFEFAGNHLTLMTLPMPLAGEQAVGYLTWERVEEARAV
jgi:hypothetical protein